MANDNKTLELQIRVATQEALKAVSSLKDEIQNLAGEAKKFESSGGTALKNSFKDAEKYSGGLTSSFSRQVKESLSAKNALGQLAASVAGAVSLYALASKAVEAFTGFVTSSVAAFAEYETIETNLAVVLGGAEKASAAFEELKEMAGKTPFSVTGLAEAAIQLNQTGTSMRDMTQILSMLGDAAGGSNEKFSRLAANYAQIQSVGKTTAMDIKQFALIFTKCQETNTPVEKKPYGLPTANDFRGRLIRFSI